MEENKNVNKQQMPQGDGGRKRRKHHKHNGNKNPQGQQGGQNVQNAQKKALQPQQGGQNAQNAQKKAPQPQQPKQNGKPQPHPQQNQQGQGKKNKNKNQNQQPQKQQNQPKNTQNNGNNANKGNNKEENRKDTYLYILDGNLYVNLTNKCSNGCDFCVRNERTSYYGHNLWIRHGDPSAERVIADAKGFGDLSRFKEVVFCGFGEPTYRVAEMLALCDYFHEKGLKTRLNTNGQGNLINKRDITPELKGKIDFVNVSLNASCYEKYQPICRSQFKEAGFAGLVEFAKLCRKNGIPCRFSIVDCIGEEEVESCKRLAESVHIPLHIRSYITDS